MKPDFLGIGAQKAGTKWLYDQLMPHPQIYLTPIKEIHYWDVYRNLRLEGKSSWVQRIRNKKWQRHLGKALNFEQEFTPGWLIRFFAGSYSEQWYNSLFDLAGDRLTGEITPEYSILPVETIRDIHNYNPNLRLIYLLREPVGRAWSSFKMFLRRNNIDIKSLSKDEVIRYLSSDDLGIQGDYATCLKNWNQVFDESQMLVHYMEEVKNEPMQVLESVCKHLDIDSEFLSSDLASQVSHEGHEVVFEDQYREYLKERFRKQNEDLYALTGSEIVKNWLD